MVQTINYKLKTTLINDYFLLIHNAIILRLFNDNKTAKSLKTATVCKAKLLYLVQTAFTPIHIHLPSLVSSCAKLIRTFHLVFEVPVSMLHMVFSLAVTQNFRSYSWNFQESCTRLDIASETAFSDI